jgi:hypothetical protein
VVLRSGRKATENSREALAEIQRVAGEARREHYFMTLPCDDSGYRVLPAACLDSHGQAARLLRSSGAVCRTKELRQSVAARNETAKAAAAIASHGFREVRPREDAASAEPALLRDPVSPPEVGGRAGPPNHGHRRPQHPLQPGFVEKLSAAELKGVLAHEVLHCALVYQCRRGKRDLGNRKTTAGMI